MEQYVLKNIDEQESILKLALISNDICAKIYHKNYKLP